MICISLKYPSSGSSQNSASNEKNSSQAIRHIRFTHAAGFPALRSMRQQKICRLPMSHEVRRQQNIRTGWQMPGL
jgi:hypothetical protein